MLWRNAEFSCHAARRGAPTTARGRVRCAVAISSLRFKSDTVLPTARHRCDISSKGAVLPGRNDAEMGPDNSLHASAYYSEYNERLD